MIERGELACKPGSVEGNHSSRSCVTTALQQPTRKHAGPTLHVAVRLPYLALLQVGFAVPSVLPRPRCALTAPFHPCQHLATLRRVAFCCTFRGLAPPRHYLAPCPLEPGLSSPPPPLRTDSAAIARPAPRAHLISPRAPCHSAAWLRWPPARRNRRVARVHPPVGHWHCTRLRRRP